MKEFNISLYLIITVHCKCVILSVVNAFLLTGFKQKKKKTMFDNWSIFPCQVVGG